MIIYNLFFKDASIHDFDNKVFFNQKNQVALVNIMDDFEQKNKIQNTEGSEKWANPLFK